MKEDIKKLLNKAVLQAKKAQGWPDFATSFAKATKVKKATTGKPNFEMPEIAVDYVKNEQFGDYSSNIAMILAKKIGKNPMEIAKAVLSVLNDQIVKSEKFEKVEFAAPGYINFYLSKKYLQNKISEINKEKKKFGNSKIGKNIKVNNEFISANPTGPLHLGNGRGGFYGDVLSKVLRKAGFEVTNEFYVNDGGGQIEKLGHSVLKDEEAVYSGEYIDKLNQKYGQLPVAEAGQKAVADVLKNIIQKTVKEKMLIDFDSWISEQKDIADKGYPEKAIAIFQDKKLVCENEGALWFKSTEFGDDKDRVLIKSDGTKTYFAIDCGYILHKIERDFADIIMNLGADHFGYLKRFEAAAKALGFAGKIEFIVCQLVRLVKDGQEVRMSKRAGNVVYVDDLIEEVGTDAARFFFLMYSPNTHMNFDLGLAKERSQKNPVFYAQYAHARICSILNKSQTSKRQNVQTLPDLSLLIHEKELSLIKELNKFPELIEEISESYEVHKLPHYAIKLADKFHSFYDECRVIDEANPELTKARLLLVNAVRIVLAETLKLIGVSAPESM